MERVLVGIPSAVCLLLPGWHHCPCKDLWSWIGMAANSVCPTLNGMTQAKTKKLLPIQEASCNSGSCNEWRRCVHWSLEDKSSSWMAYPNICLHSSNFSGSCRWFISGFSSIVSPLHLLTKRCSDFVWMRERDAAFQWLKQVLSQSIQPWKTRSS